MGFVVYYFLNDAAKYGLSFSGDRKKQLRFTCRSHRLEFFQHGQKSEKVGLHFVLNKLCEVPAFRLQRGRMLTSAWTTDPDSNPVYSSARLAEPHFICIYICVYIYIIYVLNRLGGAGQLMYVEPSHPRANTRCSLRKSLVPQVLEAFRQQPYHHALQAVRTEVPKES